MSDEQTTPSFASIEAMKYNDLKSKAAELSLDASGTKEDLVARITAHLGLEKTDGGAGDEGKGENTNSNEGGSDANKNEGNSSAPQESTTDKPKGKPLNEAQERAQQSKADRELRTDAEKMKAHLAKQRKVNIIIPFEAGENPESGKKVPFHVNLNGYAQDFPRGQYIEVPEQIAEIIKERLESEGRIGAEWRIDRDAKKLEALG